MPVATIPSSQATDGFSDTLPTTFTLGSSGVVLRSDAVYTTDAFGCQWGGSSASAFGTKPAPREVVGDRPYADGQWNATRYYQAKSYPLTGDCVAPTMAALNAAEQRLKAAVTLQTFPMLVSQAGLEGLVNVRQSGELLWTVVPVASPQAFYATFSIGLVADDPRIWSSQTRAFTLGFGAAGGPTWVDPGPDWADPGPTWADSGGSNSAVLVNPGTLPVPLVMTFTAPITTATVTLVQGSTTQTQSLANADIPGTDLLTTGQTLTVDNGAPSVLVGPTGATGRSARSWRSGAYLRVPPGQSAIYLTGVGTGSATGTYAAARL